MNLAAKDAARGCRLFLNSRQPLFYKPHKLFHGRIEMEIFVPVQGDIGRAELTDGNGMEVRFLLGDFFCQETGCSF